MCNTCLICDFHLSVLYYYAITYKYIWTTFYLCTNFYLSLLVHYMPSYLAPSPLGMHKLRSFERVGKNCSVFCRKICGIMPLVFFLQFHVPHIIFSQPKRATPTTTIWYSFPTCGWMATDNCVPVLFFESEFVLNNAYIYLYTCSSLIYTVLAIEEYYTRDILHLISLAGHDINFFFCSFFCVCLVFFYFVTSGKKAQEM